MDGSYAVAFVFLKMPQHIEFIDVRHFSQYYHRRRSPATLALFIDYFWETDFGGLWKQYPDGFSDVLFPNTGYTYLVNLGTPFTLQLGKQRFPMRTDGFLPRNQAMECYHKAGNRIFGIKFKTSPIILEKKINFAEYRESVFPLSYLADSAILKKAKSAGSFAERVTIFSEYFNRLLQQYEGSLHPVMIVNEILAEFEQEMDFSRTVEDLAEQYKVSSRTLQRYFEIYTGISTKKVLQILRIRKAVEQLLASPATFTPERFAYYDHSHFYKHLLQFLQKDTLLKLRPHLPILAKLHR